MPRLPSPQLPVSRTPRSLSLLRRLECSIGTQPWLLSSPNPHPRHRHAGPFRSSRFGSCPARSGQQRDASPSFRGPGARRRRVVRGAAPRRARRGAERRRVVRGAAPRRARRGAERRRVPHGATSQRGAVMPPAAERPGVADTAKGGMQRPPKGLVEPEAALAFILHANDKDASKQPLQYVLVSRLSEFSCHCL
ncbi:hypothetical protein ACP70R_004918 [Stipagrostis hirtigluma subsp. patula]